MKRGVYLLMAIFTGLSAFAQSARSLYIGGFSVMQFTPSSHAVYFNGGGNDAISQTLFASPALYQSITQTLGSEPFEITGPENMRVSKSSGAGMSLGIYLNRYWTLNFGFQYSVSRAFGDLSISYGDPVSPLIANGTLKTRINTFNSGLYLSRYFGTTFQPFVMVGVQAFNVQKHDSSLADFEEFSFHTGSASSNSQLGLYTGVGLSRTIDRHVLGLRFGISSYRSPYKEASEFDVMPELNISYHFVLTKKRPGTSPGTPVLRAVPQEYPDNGIMYCGGGISFKEKLDSLFNELDSLTNLEGDARKALDENDLVSELESFRKLLEALKAIDQLGEAGKEAMDALEAFIGCDNTKLVKLLRENEDTRNGVLNSLKFFATFLKIYAEQNPKHATLLNKIAKTIEEQVEKAEKALKEKNLDLAIQNITAIKTSGSWPVDVLNNILEGFWKDLEEAFGNAGKEGAKKALEIALKKLLGASAGAAASIAQDLVNMADLLWKLSKYNELMDAWNRKMIEILKLINENGEAKGSGWLDGCVEWGYDSLQSITVTAELVCWCGDPEGSETNGTWTRTDLELDPSDEKNSKTLTIKNPGNGEPGKSGFQVRVPEKAERPCKSELCYIYLTFTAITKDGQTVTAGGFAAAVN